MPIPITPALSIPEGELDFKATPGGGPGGQHVNRSATRVELWWDMEQSPSLDGAQRAMLRERIGHRLDGQGRLRIVSAVHRSQSRNRDEAVRRFQGLLQRGLTPRKQRKPTRPTRASKERRLAEKRKRSETKAQRRPVDPE